MMTRLERRGLNLVTLLLSLFLLVPWSPLFIQTASGDPAYTYSYHYLFATGAQYGVDVLHTGGPWSIIYFQEYYPDTFWLLLAGQAVVALVLATMLIVIANGYIRGTFVRLAFVLGSLALFTIAIDARYFYIALAAILFMPDFRERRVAPLHLMLCAVVALSVLVKSSFLAAGAVVLLLILVAELVHARRVPLTVALFALAVVVLNAAAGQSIAALGAYIVAMVDLSMAYPEHLSELGSYWELLAFLAIAVPVGLTVLAVEFHRRRWWGVAVAAGYGTVLFVAFKQGFVRQDGQHVIRPFCTLLLFAASYALVNRDVLRGWFGSWGEALFGDAPMGKRPLAALALGCVAGALLLGYFATRYPSLYNTKIDRLTAQARGVWSVLSTGQARFDAQHAAAKAAIRSEFPLPPADGPVAVYASLQTVAIAHGVDYRVLPTTAAQLVWTPRLDAANVRFFSAPDAPRYVLGQVPYTNRRTGLALMANYRPAGFVRNLYWLERGERHEIAFEPLMETTTRWGERVALPDVGGDLIWAKLRYRRTLIGSLVSLLYQPPPVYLVGHEESRAVSRDLIARTLATSGYLVSPHPRSVAEFAALATAEGRTYLGGRPVTAIHLEAGEDGSWLFPLDAWARYFEPEIDIAFYRVRFRPQGGAPWTPRTPEMAALRRLLALRPAAGGRVSEIILLDGGRAALAARSDTPLSLALAPGTTRLKLRFGLRPDGGRAVTFRASLRTGGDAAPTVVWSRRLDPKRAEDLGEHRVVLDLQACAGATSCAALISIAASDDGAGSAWPAYLTDVEPY